jgi:hypothetical protein
MTTCIMQKGMANTFVGFPSSAAMLCSDLFYFGVNRMRETWSIMGLTIAIVALYDFVFH